MCLLRGLVETDKQSTLDMESIAYWYSQWMNSPPFDVGTTTIKTIGLLKDPNATAVTAKQGAKKCGGSVSNSSIMRISPMAVWAA